MDLWKWRESADAGHGPAFGGRRCPTRSVAAAGRSAAPPPRTRSREPGRSTRQGAGGAPPAPQERAAGSTGPFTVFNR